MVLTIDLFQMDNDDNKAYDKVVQGYKRNVKTALKMYPKPK